MNTIELLLIVLAALSFTSVVLLAYNTFRDTINDKRENKMLVKLRYDKDGNIIPTPVHELLDKKNKMSGKY